MDKLLKDASAKELFEALLLADTQVLPEKLIADVLCGWAPSSTMLELLQARGGHPGALAEAALLCARKSQDYNQGAEGFGDIHEVDRTGYFPFGPVSYAQMLHTKALRFNSLVVKQMYGGAPNFEGLRDTALDIINYAGFFIADGDKKAQKP